MNRRKFLKVFGLSSLCLPFLRPALLAPAAEHESVTADELADSINKWRDDSQEAVFVDLDLQEHVCTVPSFLAAEHIEVGDAVYLNKDGYVRKARTDSDGLFLGQAVSRSSVAGHIDVRYYT